MFGNISPPKSRAKQLTVHFCNFIELISIGRYLNSIKTISDHIWFFVILCIRALNILKVTFW